MPIGRYERFVISFGLLILAACHGSDQNSEKPATIKSPDSVQRYVPGLGEFMLGFQIHHSKLWFAGKGKNWPLADFEIKEIDELGEDIRRYCTDRPEIKFLPMLAPAVDSLKAAILSQNLKQFQRSFYNLTNACNDCHQVVNYPFNVICIPRTPPFSNQLYSISN